MEPVKIVARFMDGGIKKGYSQDFFPNKPVFHIHSDPSGPSQAQDEILLNKLKAVFFVRSFPGNPEYPERKAFREGEKHSGRKVEVTFTHGEIMQGSILSYNPQQAGFFLFLVDPHCNNLRVFVINAALKSFRYI
jgi:hypothetical protein